MKIILFYIFFLFGNSAFGQFDSFFTRTSKSVVYLSGEYREDNKVKAANGTGFLVFDEERFIYLVTAQHVAEKLLLNQKITFTDSLDRPSTLLLSEVQNSTEIIWTYNPYADVAVLAIHPGSKLFGIKGFIPIPINWLQSKLIPPGRYKEVISFGFPLKLGVGKYFSPISTSSKIASGIIDLKRFDIDKVASFFLLDEPSIPGLSGGPVYSLPSFLNSYDSATLIGLMHGVISDITGGKFAAIVPSKFIVETINNTKRFSGVYKMYYPNGKLWTERLYENGYLIEVLSNYNPLGKLQDKGTLKNGSGLIKLYDKKGQLAAIEYWEDKKFIKIELVK